MQKFKLIAWVRDTQWTKEVLKDSLLGAQRDAVDMTEHGAWFRHATDTAQTFVPARQIESVTVEAVQLIGEGR